MLPASNRGAGMNLCFPDVCLTPAPPAPPIPVPYPNIAMNAQATGFAPNVKVSGMNALNLGTRIPMTSGDEAGAAHPTIKGGGGYTLGNPIVSINKLPAINLTCPTNANNMNAPMGAVLVPSAVNVMYCRRAQASDVPSDGGATAWLRDDGIGVLVLRSIASSAPAQLFAARRRLVDAGAAAWILDLRDNPGGDVEAALAVASDFLADGTVMGELRDHDGDATPLRGRCTAPDRRPLAVLVDGGTASSAEVLAGVLQALGRAVVVGAQTYGKASVQRYVASMEHGLRYGTVGRILLPGGRSFDGAGLTPDLACTSAEALERAVLALTE